MPSWTAVLARLGTPTGDGRIIAPGALDNRPLPLPLMWQEATGMGHDGAVVVGRIDTIDYDAAGGVVLGRGVLLDVPEMEQVLELVTNGVIGPSLDLDETTSVLDEDDRLIVTDGRISGATLVPIPAFAEVSISMDAPEPVDEDDMDDPDEVERLPYIEPGFAAAAAAEGQRVALLAAAGRTRGPSAPPAAWFDAPELAAVTPLTVTPEGRVFGHIAPWGTCYVGLPGCTTAPRSPSGYAYFHTHAQRTAEGHTLPVGALSVGEGHAPVRGPGASAAAAMRHYEDVATVAARVTVGEDEHGIWCAGALVPGLDPVLLDRFVSSPLSGDWRPIGGAMELIAACSVNTAGFPIPRARAMASFAAGETRALVAPLTTPVRGDTSALVTSLSGVVNDRNARARWEWARVKGAAA